MPGEWEKPKYHQKYRQNPKYNQDPKYRQNPKYNQDPAIRKSINKYYELRDGVLKYLAEEGCIVTECDTINPNELKTDFGKYVNAINKLTENTIKMNQQLDEKSEIDEYSIQNFKKDNEEILKEKDEILKEIEDCKEKMNMEKEDIFETIFNAKRNQYANLDCLKEKHLSKINEWLKKNNLPIMSDDPDVENSIASIPIYNPSKRQNHTIRSFLDQLQKSKPNRPGLIVYDNDDDDKHVLKIKINTFKTTEYYSQNSPKSYQPQKQKEELPESKGEELPESESDSD